MTAVGHHLQLRVADTSVVDFTAIQRGYGILLPPDQQGLNFDRRKEVPQRQAVHVWLPGDPTRHLAMLLDEIRVLRCPLVPKVAAEFR